MRFEHRNTVACSEAGTPIMSLMIWSDSGAARAVTTSHPPRGATASINWSATAPMLASMSVMRRGLNAAETIRRSRA